jgi:hypothetical protein
MIKLRHCAIAASALIGIAIGRGPLAEPTASHANHARACADAAQATGRAREDAIGQPARVPAAARGSASTPLDPRSKKYDAVVAARILSLTSAELWEREPRDEVFAVPRERFFQGRFVEILRPLVPSAALESVECRRGTCLLALSAATEEAGQLDAALGFIPIGDRFVTESSEGESGRTQVLVHVSVTREHMDHATFGAWFETWWSERWRLARERYDRDQAATTGAADGGAP